MKNELDEKIMADSVAFRTKKYDYLLDDGKTNQKNVYKQINSKTK